MNQLLKYFSIEEFAGISSSNYMPSKCLAIDLRLFNGTMDDSNVPYVYHLIRVAMKQDTKVGVSAALLHDLVEDIKGISRGDLAAVGVSEEVLDIVELLTKKEKDDYIDDYIGRIIESDNLIALEIKYADITDNMRPDRLRCYSKDVVSKKLETYKKAHEIIKQTITNHKGNKRKCKK